MGLAADVKAQLDIVAEVQAAGVELRPKGGHLWARCPFHGGGQERTPSFQVTPGRGWYCYACNEGGSVLDFLAKLQGCDFKTVLRAAATRVSTPGRPTSPERPRVVVPTPAQPCTPLEGDLVDLLASWQKALLQSPAAAYLLARGIPLDVAAGAGLGFTATGWPGKRLAGRPVLVFPLTDANNNVVSMAARRLGADEPRWDFLPGKPRAPFCGHALAGCGELWIVEGGVDALALRAAGVAAVVAAMGSSLSDLPWNAPNIVLALDADETGRAQAERMARNAALLGKRVRILPPGNYGGAKDVAEAWQAGTLTLYADEVPDEHREDWQERAAIMLDAGVPLAVAEQAALREVTVDRRQHLAA